MIEYTIRVPEENDPGELAFLDAIEEGAGSHTLGMTFVNGQIVGVRHFRLGVSISRKVADV